MAVKPRECRTCKVVFTPPHTGAQKTCSPECSKAWFRKRNAATTKASYRKRKLESIERLGGECMKCGGVFHPAVMDFHHRDPKQKDIMPGASLRRWSEERYIKEIDKCDLLCSNCHRTLHASDWSAVDASEFYESKGDQAPESI